MKCLRCGTCCIKYAVIIVDDPALGIAEDNLVIHLGDGPCKHLLGTTPGEYSCALHDYSWYEETPCFSHTQVGSPDSECRIGAHKLNGKYRT